jgi:DNA polymerase III delta subunit
MLFCLYGPDSYRRNQKIKKLISPYHKKYKNTDVCEVDLGDDAQWEFIRDFLNQPSMFVDSKVAIIKNATIIEEREWIHVLKSQLKTEKTFVFLSEEKKPSSDFNFLLQNDVQNEEFQEPSGATLKKFVMEELKNHNTSFDSEALELFISFLLSLGENRSWRAVREIEKLSLLGLKDQIKKDNLAPYMKTGVPREMFSIAQTILYEKSIQARLFSLERIFLQNEPCAYVFNLVASLARGEKTTTLADYDIFVKSGKMGYEEVLLELAIKK